VVLEFLDYDLVVRGSDYAKYYFILRTLSRELAKVDELKGDWGDFPLKGPVPAERMMEIQKNTAKVESELKESTFDKTF